MTRVRFYLNKSKFSKYSKKAILISLGEAKRISALRCQSKLGVPEACINNIESRCNMYDNNNRTQF